MNAQETAPLTVAEYLEIERRLETRNEYWNGRMAEMPHGNILHGQIISNLIGHLGLQLKKERRCLFMLGLRLHVVSTGLYTYPDLAVVCEETEVEDQESDTFLNPALIVEVFSPATEARDRGKKFEHYRSIDSLTEYLLVSQTEPRVDQYLRQDGGHWLFTAVAGLDRRISLPSIQCELSLAEVYDKVDLV